MQKGRMTSLSVTQEKVETEEMVNGVSENWGNILKVLKEAVEKNDNSK